MFIGGPEEIRAAMEEQKRQHDLYHMHLEDMGNRFRTLVYTDLVWDDVEVLHHVFRWITEADDPRALAAYYEGVCGGVLGYRQQVNGEGPPPKEDPLVDAAEAPGVEPQERIIGVIADGDDPLERLAEWQALHDETELPDDPLLGGN